MDNKPHYKMSSIVFIIFFSISLLVFVPNYTTSFDLPRSGRVIAVFDGDTIMLKGGIKIRYLGIDAPEIAHDDKPADCYGREAKWYNHKLVYGKIVTLKYDREKKDRHGRLLAYVYTPDGKCVNAELIKHGYAFVFRKPEGFKKLVHFLRLQDLAMQKRRGMWGFCKTKRERFYIGNKNSFVFHRPSCPYGKRTSIRNRIIFRTREEAFREGFHPCRRCKP